MKLLKQNQYNQGVGKYKLLSSTAGVGSIITTKLGSYVLISDINKWKFIKWVNSRIELIRSNNTDDRKVFKLCEKEISNRGLDFINDQRFVNFIKSEKNLNNLVCLVGIPHMALDENFNTPKWTKKVNNQTLPSHPIAVALNNAGEEYKSVYSNYQVQGTHFPKWFKNDKGELKKIDEWQSLWRAECNRFPNTLKMSYFAPPRDATKYLNREISSKNEDGNLIKIREYKTLEQTNLVLICPNGHLSDIPWSNFLRWKTEKYLRNRPDEDKGENLMSNEMVGPCCSNPKLIWTESKTKSEGYGSIYIECNSCGLGSGSDKDKPKINLEGINSLEPCCIGQKPWELDIDNPTIIPYETCFVRNENNNGREKMRIALVTANNVYYANGFSSLFIPMHLAENKSKELIDALDILEKKYNKYFDRIAINRHMYWESKFDLNDFLIDNDISPLNERVFKMELESEFLDKENSIVNSDNHENYRWQEYRCFSQNSLINGLNEFNGLRFKDINLPNVLPNFFKKIQQVEELKVTNVQLDFTRVKPKERIVVNGEVKETSSSQNIFSIDPQELFTLPANETLGEGLFFEFSNEKIDSWISENINELENRFKKYLLAIPDSNSQGLSSKMKIYNNRYKHFLIHSFSHMMIRELEFSCGYPTSSLKERLYISTNPNKNMSGVLIYTAEGSEGSMGGLVSQGEPEKIFEILKRGLERSTTCSSDPLCWESDGQGIFDLNLSACFSCSLVAETACEELNLGLDRRILVDEEFGFFGNIS
ncbi:DrmB family protein [Sphingobacterium kyonggiense]